METLRDRMEADLKIGGYSASTRKIYLLYARLFARHHMRSPKLMGAREIRQFLLHVVEERMASRTTVRQARPITSLSCAEIALNVAAAIALRTSTERWTYWARCSWAVTEPARWRGPGGYRGIRRSSHYSIECSPGVRDPGAPRNFNQILTGYPHLLIMYLVLLIGAFPLCV